MPHGNDDDVNDDTDENNDDDDVDTNFDNHDVYLYILNYEHDRLVYSSDV